MQSVLESVVNYAANRAEQFKPKYLAVIENKKNKDAEAMKIAAEQAEAKQKQDAIDAEAKRKQDAIIVEARRKQDGIDAAKKKVQYLAEMNTLCNSTGMFTSKETRLSNALYNGFKLSLNALVGSVGENQYKATWGVTLKDASKQCIRKKLIVSSYSDFDVDLFEAFAHNASFNSDMDQNLMCDKDKKTMFKLHVMEKATLGSKEQKMGKESTLKTGIDLINAMRCVSGKS